LARVTALPVHTVSDGVTVAVRLTPKASRNGIDGLAANADGTAVLRARVTAAPESGKANAALIRLLAKSWKLPKSALTITAGATDRRKVIHVDGDPGALRTRLTRWIETQNG
jgi:uncharacterized protein (TIGR00251 family)